MDGNEHPSMPPGDVTPPCCAIELLAERLQSAADWLGQEAETRALRLGYFDASTGAGAALVAAARDPMGVRAVVAFLD